MDKTFTIVFIFIFIFLSVCRNTVWENDHSLWTDAIGKSPLKPKPYNNMGWSYSKTRNADLAINNWFYALKLDPNNGIALNNLLETYDVQGRTHELLPIFEAFLNNNPKAFNVMYFIGKTYILRGDTNKGFTYIEKSINNVSNIVNAADDLVYIIKNYNSTLEIGKSEPLKREEVLNILGALSVKKGNVDRGIELLRGAVKINPSFSAGHDYLGVLLFKKGMIDEAIRQFQDAIENSPK